MQLVKSKSDIASSAAVGCGFAVVWYGASSMLLSGNFSSFVSVAGAIAIAGVLPPALAARKSVKKTERIRLSMSQRLNALNKHASINIVDHKNRLTEVNDHLLALTGYNREELIAEDVKILYDSSHEKVADEIRSFLERGQTWQGETQLRRKDGTVLITQSTVMPLFDEDGNWSGSISARTDVTQTNALMADRNTAQTLNELRDDIWIVDSETEKFSYMNRAAKARFDMVKSEYCVKGLEDFSREHEIEGVLHACRTLRRDGETTTQFESSLMGVPMHVNIKFLPRSNESGRYLILFNDLTATLEQDKQKAAFVSTVSHELRSPLTSIKGAMGLLLSGSVGELPDKALTLLEIAHRNADRLVLIINDILDLDKISSGQMEFDIQDVDLVDLLKEADKANAMLQRRFGVSVVLEGTDKPVSFRTDPNRLFQVLTNLMSNAYKFSSPNGQITLALDEYEDSVRISVEDQGQGIPVAEQSKIFDRFVDMTNSDRTAKGGTGLGLSICKAIVENLGGTIGFETTEGVGTTFYFTLPKRPKLAEADDFEVKHSA